MYRCYVPFMVRFRSPEIMISSAAGPQLLTDRQWRRAQDGAWRNINLYVQLNSCALTHVERRGRCGRYRVRFWGCYGPTPSRPPASMSEPWGDPSTSPVPCEARRSHATSSALSLQLMGTAVTRRRLPDPTHPARAPAFVVGTGDDYASGFAGGDKFFLFAREDRPDENGT
jgi:hypothetical protein